MTDNFERAKDEILKAARANGGVTTEHLFDALIATNADLDAQHEQTIAWHEGVVGMVNAHFIEANLRDERIAVLEKWREKSSSTCVETVTAIVRAEHEERHAEHMAACHLEPRRKDDPKGSDFSGERSFTGEGDEEMGDMRRAWRVLRWGVAAFVIPIIATAGYQLAQLIFE